MDMPERTFARRDHKVLAPPRWSEGMSIDASAVERRMSML
jgi:hypothetical protein